MTRSRAVVIGGGVTGLATACLLARDGHCVTVLEENESLGGRAGSWQQDGFTFDTGPSWYLMPEVFDHFYRLMGTSTDEQLELVQLEPGYRVYGEPHGGQAPEAIDIEIGRSAIETFERLEAGAGAQLQRYINSASRTYDAAVQSFLYNTFASWRNFMSRRIIAAVPRLLPLLTQSLWRFIAKRFTNNRLRQILAYPAVFLGTSPFAAPALYHLMSRMDLVDGVQYPRGGFAAFVRSLEKLARENGVELRTGCEVVDIESQDGRVKSVQFRTQSGQEQIDADIVVSAADVHHTETKLLQPADRTFAPKHWQNEVTGPSAVLVMLGVRGELPELPHHTLFFSDDWQDNFAAIFDAPSRIPEPPSLYVCKPSATDDVAPEGHENLFVLVPLPPDPAIGRGGVARQGDALVNDIADRAIAQIGEWAGISDLESRIVVRKTVGPRDFESQFNTFRGSALGPSHILKQSAFFRGVNRSRKVSGLFYAGATTVPGVGLPMCLISAELILKHLRGDTTPGPTTER